MLMTTEEFSTGFDTLISNRLTSSSSFGEEEPLSFNEYEKSYFLTKSQIGLVRELYAGGPIGSFEATEELRRALFSLVDSITLTPYIPNDALTLYSYYVTLPSQVMYIVYEQAEFEDSNPCINGKRVKVTPVTHDSLNIVLDNPFRGPSENRVLRVDSNLNNGIIELISAYNLSKYTIRFLKKPTPIILTDLGEESIDGVNIKSECILSPMLHHIILEKAVELALQSRVGNTAK